MKLLPVVSGWIPELTVHGIGGMQGLYILRTVSVLRISSEIVFPGDECYVKNPLNIKGTVVRDRDGLHVAPMVR
jgi:hypothetical protein